MSSAASLAVCLLLGSSPGEAAESSATPVAVERIVRPPHELRKAINEALKHSSPATNPDPYVVAPELIAVFDELRYDTQIEEFDRKRFLGLLRSRLVHMVERLEKPARAKQSAAPKSIETRGEVLAQQAPPGAAGLGAAGANPAGNAGRGQGPPDYGPALVDLIKRTIAPTTWDDVGGPGSIYYYRPLRVLVIRQTGEVHEKIGGALGNLRK